MNKIHKYKKVKIKKMNEITADYIDVSAFLKSLSKHQLLLTKKINQLVDLVNKQNE